MKGFNLLTLLTQVSESTNMKGETPLTFPGIYPLEGDSSRVQLHCTRGRWPSASGNGCKPAVASSGCTHELKARASLNRPRDILLALGIFVPFDAIYTIASHQFGKK